MKIKITNKDLKNFLKERGLTKEFKKEIRAHHDCGGTLKVGCIIQAFSWSNSAKGFQYWKSVNGAFYEKTVGEGVVITLSKGEHDSLIRYREAFLKAVTSEMDLERPKTTSGLYNNKNNQTNIGVKLHLKNYGDCYLELDVSQNKTTIENKEEAKELLSNLLNVSQGLREYIKDKIN